MINRVYLFLSSKIFFFLLVLNSSINVYSQVSVTGIAIVPDSLEIVEGFDAMLTASIFPEDADDKGISWSTDSPSVVSVDSLGMVTALTVGTALITATTDDGGFASSSYIEVQSAPIQVTGIEIVPDSLKIVEGFDATLTATIFPEDADEKGVIWSTDSPSIVTVDSLGTLTALTVGTALVTVTTDDGGFTSSAFVEVLRAPIRVSGIEIVPDSLEIVEGFDAMLTATIFPEDADDKGIIWSTDSPSVVSVDSLGMVTALTVGTALITATTDDGGFASSSYIEVQSAPIQVTGIAIVPDSLKIVEGFDATLTATIFPEDADDKGIIWSTDSPSVVSVDSLGMVTALTVGTALVTVTTDDGGFTSSAFVEVLRAPIRVTGIEIVPDSLEIVEGFDAMLTATIFPEDADEKGVIWSTDSPSVVSVDSLGMVTALTVGTALVTVTTDDGGFTSSAFVEVLRAPIRVTGIEIVPDSLEIVEGFDAMLTATIFPEDADDKGIIWSTDSPSVVSVDSLGMVTALTVGTALVTVTTDDGGFTSSAFVEVLRAPIRVTGIEIVPDSLEIVEGFDAMLTATIFPEDADDKGISWSTDSPSVVSVDSLGMVTALTAGIAKVTATTNDGGFIFNVAITVKRPLNEIGKWSEPIPFGIVPVAVANLPDGKLVAWSSKYKDYFGGADGFTYTEIFDPFAGENGMPMGEKVTTTNHDMFCPGVNNLGNGQILVTGGSSNPKATLYDFTTDTWIPMDNMNIGRGYHGAVTLSDGSAMVIGGSWSGGLAPNGEKIAELWREERGWKILPGLKSDILFNSNDLAFEKEGVYRADNHSWLWAAPNGKIFHAGPGEDMHWIDVNGEGSFTDAGKRLNDTYSMKGNTVMFDVGKLLKTGGATSYASGDAAKDNSFVIDINDENNVTVTPTINNLSFSRTMQNSVVLPNGEVLVTGGLSTARVFTDDGARLDAEIFNPETNGWRTLAGMHVPRTYHSVAILQADGRVFVGGGGLCNSCSNHLDAEIFTPPYLFDANGDLADRPTIDAPESADYNSVIQVSGSEGIAKFSLIRMSSSTHSTNNEQRRIPVSFSGDGNYTLNIPDRNILPPGYYMLFALNVDGVPSVAESVLVGMPIVLTSGVVLSEEAVELDIGDEQELIATVVPGNAENTLVTWSTNNPSVATVNLNGQVTAISTGTAMITATTDDGAFTARTNIVVDGGCTFSNVALGGTAVQSSTYGNGKALVAIDGITAGNSPWVPNVQHTANEDSAWWELDLGSDYIIEEIKIFNRGGGLESRLNNFYVFVSKRPFSSRATLESLKSNGNIEEYYFEGEAGLKEVISLNTDGRYIRIQLSNSGILNLVEVEVQGCFLGSSKCEGVLPPIILPSGPFIAYDSIQTLEATPLGGVWSGASTDGTFDPSKGPGKYSVTYTSDNGNGCVQSYTRDIMVNSSCTGIDPPNIIASGPYLDTDGIQTLKAMPAGGTWSGMSTDGTFDPSVGEGIYSVTYTYDNGKGCIQTETADIRVNTLGSRGCVLSNIALNGLATQSSTYGNGVASVAIDGNTEGTSPWSGSLQHTLNENNPWWELDLGVNAVIEELRIYNRTNGLEGRLNNFYVFVSNIPFTPEVTLESLRQDDSIYEYYFNDEAGLQENLKFDAEGQYLRIQLSSFGILHMSEVEVMGCILDTSQCADNPEIVIENIGPFANTDEIQTLVASIDGGTWSGATTDGIFDPSVGPGVYSITYSHNSGEGCFRSKTIEVEVNLLSDSGCAISNIAINGRAIQSSTYGNGHASAAIDGNTQGISPWSGDLQHTTNESNPWWQLDLGVEREIEELRIYNRASGLEDRLNNFYILISKTQYESDATLESLIEDETVFQYYFEGSASLKETLKVIVEGRYIRIQLSGNGILHLSEVEVMSCKLQANTTSLKAYIDSSNILPDYGNEDGIVLAPNPVSSKLKIMGVSMEMVSKILIYDMEGRLVLNLKNKELNTGYNMQSFDVSRLVKGVYQLNVTLRNGKTHTKQFLKK
ncbi:Ig-like domain-containing protein [Zobellia roscoffensis]|uniref:Ig-like domain-containing protein n=2 Tax=Zobellia roscoffensis TaxID=2779508 RepID=UPI00188D5AFF|nr:Ig-like domain-containing protein [Zobellia roscoffensis]